MQIWTDIRRKVLVEKVPKRQICRDYQISFHTLEKMLQNVEPTGYQQRPGERPRPKLGAFLESRRVCCSVNPLRDIIQFRGVRPATRGGNEGWLTHCMPYHSVGFSGVRRSSGSANLQGFPFMRVRLSSLQFGIFADGNADIFNDVLVSVSNEMVLRVGYVRVHVRAST